MTNTVQKMKFSIKDLFSKCDQIRVTSRDHMIKGTCGLVNGGHSTQDTILPKLVLVGLLEEEM